MSIKMAQKARLWIKNRQKNVVIHNISTKCGYMDSNNVEMWITGITPKYSKKKIFKLKILNPEKAFIYGLFNIFYLTLEIKIYIMRMLFATQDRRWPAGETACEDFSL